MMILILIIIITQQNSPQKQTFHIQIKIDF